MKCKAVLRQIWGFKFFYTIFQAFRTWKDIFAKFSVNLWKIWWKKKNAKIGKLCPTPLHERKKSIFFCLYCAFPLLYYSFYSLLHSSIVIDDFHISNNASGMEANIRVRLIRNSSSHSSLDVNGLELPCLAATLCFTRLCNQGNSLMRSWYKNELIRNCELTTPSAIEKFNLFFLTFLARGHWPKYFLKVCSWPFA